MYKNTFHVNENTVFSVASYLEHLIGTFSRTDLKLAGQLQLISFFNKIVIYRHGSLICLNVVSYNTGYVYGVRGRKLVIVLVFHSFTNQKYSS